MYLLFFVKRLHGVFYIGGSGSSSEKFISIRAIIHCHLVSYCEETFWGHRHLSLVFTLMGATTSRYQRTNGHQPDRQSANRAWIPRPDTWLTLHDLNYMPEAIIGLLSFYPKHQENIYAPRHTTQQLRRTHCYWLVIRTVFIEKLKKFRKQRRPPKCIYCDNVFLRAVFLLRPHKNDFQTLQRPSEFRGSQVFKIEVWASLWCLLTSRIGSTSRNTPESGL